MGGYVIRRARGADLPGIGDLLTRTLPTISSHELATWTSAKGLSSSTRLVLAACPVGVPNLVVATVRISKDVTHGHVSARLEVVVADPDRHAHDLMSALMARAFFQAQVRWRAQAITWKLEDVPEHQMLRHLCIYVIGAGLDPGSNSNYTLPLGWKVPDKLLPHFVAPDPGE